MTKTETCTHKKRSAFTPGKPLKQGVADALAEVGQGHAGPHKSTRECSDQPNN
ncbi:MAG: hypothetical protein IJV00_01350 [Clostridia bacterium]|nr:hypothetical protein [Clostridia bacterium]